MNAIALKARIKKKFGSLSKFAARAKMDRYQLQKMFATPNRYHDALKNVSVIAGKLPKGKPSQVPGHKVAIIRKAIVEAGGVNAWCDANEGFSSRSVFQILQGRRKVMSEGVQKLFNHFNL